jgi:hypothetical protein
MMCGEVLQCSYGPSNKVSNSIRRYIDGMKLLLIYSLGSIFFINVYVKLEDRKRSLSGKNDHNALWHYRNSHNAKFRVVAVFKQPQRDVACEDMP